MIAFSNPVFVTEYFSILIFPRLLRADKKVYFWNQPLWVRSLIRLPKADHRLGRCGREGRPGKKNLKGRKKSQLSNIFFQWHCRDQQRSPTYRLRHYPNKPPKYVTLADCLCALSKCYRCTLPSIVWRWRRRCDRREL